MYDDDIVLIDLGTKRARLDKWFGKRDTIESMLSDDHSLISPAERSV